VPQLHHVNLGVPKAQLDAEEHFLSETLGMRRLEPPPELPGRARWFGCDGGVEVHLSEDDAVIPQERGHVALVLGTEFPLVTERVHEAGLATSVFELSATEYFFFCTDPAGHRWELRSS
jgi:catechol 2,3-dioxygenase-like lactoylglutathione lyase family enzyme